MPIIYGVSKGGRIYRGLQPERKLAEEAEIERKGRPVIAFDLERNERIEYPSAFTAACALDCAESTVQKRCRGLFDGKPIRGRYIVSWKEDE